MPPGAGAKRMARGAHASAQMRHSTFCNARQCGAIGYAGASVYVPHPMQNRTTAELHAFAEASADEVLAALTKGQVPAVG